MSRTRLAPVKIEKKTETELLHMILEATDKDLWMPSSIIISLSNRRTLARLYDNGLIQQVGGHTGGLWYFIISDKGREACNQ